MDWKKGEPRLNRQSRPRIVYVISTRGTGGGGEKLLAALVRQGQVRGYEQLVVNPFANESAPELAELFHPVAYRAFPWEGVAKVARFRRSIEVAVNDFQPDIVHVFLFHASVLMASIPPPANARRLVTHLYGEGIRIHSYPFVHYHLDKWAARRFDMIVAISRSVERYLVANYGYPSERVRCIPLGWEGPPLPGDLEPRPPTVVCVGNLRPEKGHAVLVSAFAEVVRRVPDARLILVGAGRLHTQLAEQVEALGLGGQVEFTGAVPTAWPYLARADVFALPSHTEAFGIAVAEAMAAGLPVVASAVGAIPELVEPGVTGELFPPGDHHRLAEHLVRLLLEPELRSTMGIAGRQAAERVTMERTVQRNFDVYDELLSSPPDGLRRERRRRRSLTG